jgi:hypothetical protein
MATSDGISTEDWDRLHELVLEVVNTETGEAEERIWRARLLNYLEELEEKYGSRPSILATRADFITDDVSVRQALLIRAYALAAEVADVRNQLLIASSLAALAVEELKDREEAARWLARAEEYLGPAGTDVERRECERIREALRGLIKMDGSPP